MERNTLIYKHNVHYLNEGFDFNQAQFQDDDVIIKDEILFKEDIKSLKQYFEQLDNIDLQIFSEKDNIFEFLVTVNNRISKIEYYFKYEKRTLYLTTINGYSMLTLLKWCNDLSNLIASSSLYLLKEIFVTFKGYNDEIIIDAPEYKEINGTYITYSKNLQKYTKLYWETPSTIFINMSISNGDKNTLTEWVEYLKWYLQQFDNKYLLTHINWEDSYVWLNSKNHYIGNGLKTLLSLI